MKRLASVVLSSTMAISGAGVLSGVNLHADENVEVLRVSGRDRYDTPVQLSRKFFSNSDYAIVASGQGYADALIGGTLASHIKAPIFLTEKNSIRKDVLYEMKRLGVKKVFLLGGYGSVSQNVENTIKSAGFPVRRAGGANREETSNKICGIMYDFYCLEYLKDHPEDKEVREHGLASTDFYAGIDAYGFADSMVAAPLMAAYGNYDNQMMPVLNFNRKKSFFPFPIIFGGENTLPDYRGDGTVIKPKHRFAGSNRYKTAVSVAGGYKTLLGRDIKTVVLVDGTNYPDALASSTVATVNNAAILLTEPGKLNADTKKYIENKGIEKVIVIGGEYSVSENVVRELKGQETIDKNETSNGNEADNEDMSSQDDWRESYYLGDILFIDLNRNLKNFKGQYVVEAKRGRKAVDESYLTGEYESVGIYYKPMYDKFKKGQYTASNGVIEEWKVFQVASNATDDEVLLGESSEDFDKWIGVNVKYLITKDDGRRYLLINERFGDRPSDYGYNRLYNAVLKNGEVYAFDGLYCVSEDDDMEMIEKGTMDRLYD